MKCRLKYIYNKINTITTYIYCCICTMLLVSCAQIGVVGGGKKDTTPPQVVRYIPDSASLNFTAKTITISFDELIQLKDLNNQLIISPPLVKTPEIKIKDKTLTINFDKNEVLKPNTTYSFSFGNALRDNNEGNPKENFKYIFSTGSFIDSLTIKGKVENAFDHKTEKGIFVMLYSDFSDSVIYKKRPDYFGKTNEAGNFQIDNLHGGNYKMMALKDANANYKYSQGESVGFADSLVDAAKTQNIRIELFQEPEKKFYMKKRVHPSYGKVVFIFNKPADSLQIRPINHIFKENDVILDFSKNKDSLNYWFENFDKDSIVLEISNGTKIDTVSFKVIKKEEALKSKKNSLKLNLLSSPNGNKNFDLGAELKLQFSNPIVSIKQTENIQLLQDSLPYKTKWHLTFNKYGISTIKIGYWDSSKTYEDIDNLGVFIVSPEFRNLKLKENTNYHLFIPSGTFTDIFGLTNDTIKIDFKTREEKYYGTVKLDVTIPETKYNYIIQLLDEKENIIRENNIKKSETINYEYVYPQKYKLKIIYDDNINYRWDTGNLLQKRQPERVMYDPEPINIRSNWDVDLVWKVKE